MESNNEERKSLKDEFYERYKPNSYKLDKPGDIESIEDDEIVDLIQSLWSSRERADQVVGSIICAVITNKKPVFILSYSEVNRVLKNDLKNPQSQASDPVLQDAFVFLKGSSEKTGILMELYPPSVGKKGGQKSRAGLYKVTLPHFVDYIDASEDKILALVSAYEDSNGISSEHQPPKKKCGLKKQKLEPSDFDNNDEQDEEATPESRQKAPIWKQANNYKNSPGKSDASGNSKLNDVMAKYGMK